MSTAPFTVLRISDTHEWRLSRPDQHYHGHPVWGLHYLPSAEPDIPLRIAARFESEMLNAAKREVEAARASAGNGGVATTSKEQP